MPNELHILRMNVLNRAVDMHNAGKIEQQDILPNATKFEQWVLDKEKNKEIPSKDGCSKCGTEKMTKDVKKFSKDKFGKVLCFNYQKKEQT